MGRGQTKGESCTSSRFTRSPTRTRSGAGSWTCRKATELPIVAPSSDGTRGVCVFKSDSVTTVRNLVEGAAEEISSNEYYTINDGNAQGLPV
jgi:hypothetical protein